MNLILLKLKYAKNEICLNINSTHHTCVQKMATKTLSTIQ